MLYVAYVAQKVALIRSNGVLRPNRQESDKNTEIFSIQIQSILK